MQLSLNKVYLVPCPMNTMKSKERIGQMHNCFLFCSHPKEQNEPIILHWHRWLEESFCYRPPPPKKKESKTPNKFQIVHNITSMFHLIFQHRKKMYIYNLLKFKTMPPKSSPSPKGKTSLLLFFRGDLLNFQAVLQKSSP